MGREAEFSPPNYFLGGGSRYNSEFLKHSRIERVLCSRSPQNVIKLQAKHSVNLRHLSHARSAFAPNKRIRYFAENTCNLAVVNVWICAVQIA